MSDLKISELPLAENVADDDVLVGNAGATTSRLHVNRVSDLGIMVWSNANSRYETRSGGITRPGNWVVRFIGPTDPGALAEDLDEWTNVEVPGEVPGVIPAIFDDAVAFWTAREYDAVNARLTDLSGNGHHAVLPGEAANPQVLPHTDTQYMYVPGGGIFDNRATTPSSSALNPSGDFELRCALSFNSFAASDQALIAKWDNTTQRSYRFYVSGVQSLELAVTPDGTFGSSVPFASGWNVETGIGANQWVELRVTFDATLGRARFYQRTTPSGSWSQVGAPADYGALAAFAGTDALTVAHNANQHYLHANIYKAQLWDGIEGSGGTLVAHFDPTLSTQPHTSFVAATGETWTILRRSIDRKTAIIDRPTLQFGLDDYLEVASHADLAAASMTAIVVTRVYGTSANQAFIAKKADFTTGAGWSLDRGTGGLTPRVMLADGTNNPTATAPLITAGFVTGVSLVRDATNITGYKDGTAGTPVTDTSGSIANAFALRIGRLSDAGTSYADMEFMGAAVFPRALSSTEIEEVVAWLS